MEPRRHLLRILCLSWSAAWAIVWVLMTAHVLLPHSGAEQPSNLWFRTAALLCAWAGLFAYKALDPPP